MCIVFVDNRSEFDVVIDVALTIVIVINSTYSAPVPSNSEEYVECMIVAVTADESE